jgi:hypothetical protein
MVVEKFADIPVTIVHYTFTHKQYTEQHNQTEYTERNIYNNKNVNSYCKAVIKASVTRSFLSLKVDYCYSYSLGIKLLKFLFLSKLTYLFRSYNITLYIYNIDTTLYFIRLYQIMSSYMFRPNFKGEFQADLWTVGVYHWQCSNLRVIVLQELD